MKKLLLCVLCSASILFAQTVGVVSNANSPYVIDSVFDVFFLRISLAILALVVSLFLVLKTITYNKKSNDDILKKFLEAMFDGVVLHAGGVILDANTNFSKIVSCSLNEAIGKNLSSFFNTLNKESFIAFLKIDSANTITVFKKINHEDRYFLVKNKAIRWGKRDFFVATFEDISEKERFAKIAEESETNYKRLIDSMLDALALHEVIQNEEGEVVDYRFLMINPAFEKETGLKAEDLIGKTVLEVLPQTEKYWIEMYGDVALTGNEARFQNYSGALDRHYDVLAFSPKQGQFVTLFRNVTDAVKNEEKMLRYTKDLEKSNKELEQFAYVASHDLQEPLRKIEAFSDRIKTMLEDSLNEKISDYFDRMLNATHRMRTLIEALLSYSRVSASLETERVDLNVILKEAKSDLEFRINEKNAVIECPQELPTIEADATRMRQLFENLISNSLKFTKKDTPPVISIESKTNNGNIDIIFSDNGIGFDEKDASKIFEIFSRLHSRSEYEGTGIGLSICHKIVEAHGGNIEAVGKTDEGAKFIITLPISH